MAAVRTSPRPDKSVFSKQSKYIEKCTASAGRHGVLLSDANFCHREKATWYLLTVAGALDDNAIKSRLLACSPSVGVSAFQWPTASNSAHIKEEKRNSRLLLNTVWQNDKLCQIVLQHWSLQSGKEKRMTCNLQHPHYILCNALRHIM